MNPPGKEKSINELYPINKKRKQKYTRKKRDIEKKYEIFLKYLFDHYNKRSNSIEVCIYKFKKSYKYAKSPSVQQVYNWIRDNKIFLTEDKLYYKKRRSKNNSIMRHTLWSLENKTVLPIRLRLNT